MKIFLKKTLSSLINAQTDNERISIITRVLKEKNISYNYVTITQDLEKDPYFTKNIEFGKKNIRVELNVGATKTLILNSHFDTVPASQTMKKAHISGDNIFGRGACDALGQITLLLGIINTISKEDLSCNLIIHFVNCEETGGNGTLAILTQEKKADFAIVFEPTNLRVCNASRGALWFNIKVLGKSTHMATYFQGDNAIIKAHYIISELEGLWETLIKESANHTYFKYYEHPIQVNIGNIISNGFNAALPSYVEIKCAIGFLSDKTIEEIKQRIKKSSENAIKKYLLKYPSKVKKNFELDFNYIHNDPYSIEENDHIKLLDTITEKIASEYYQNIIGFPASCDARLFYCRNKIDVAIFGPGKLSKAHSDEESININELIKGVKIMQKFIKSFK